MTELLTTAREALGRHAWDEAMEAFVGADREESLSPGDLEQLADAAWWAGHPDQAEEALERAFAGHERAGSHLAAAAMALRLSERTFRRGAYAIARGWLARAERFLDGAPDSPVHAWLNFMRTANSLLYDNDPETAISYADQAIEIGRRHGDMDVQAIAMSFKGSALLRTGQVAQGLSLVDEATAIATSGALGVKAACDVYCVTIGACRTLADYRRAGEWTDQAERWMRRESIRGYTGVCRLHRAELKRLRGEWPEAEAEARRACEELERYRLMDDVGYAYSEIGEVRLHMGDLEAAEEAFATAFQLGWDPQPGLALVHLARGDLEEAATSMSRSLAVGEEGETTARDPLHRVRLLPAFVEIALARGDLAGAREATDELEEIAGSHDSAAWLAAAVTARGSLLLAEGDPGSAISHLDRAWRMWHEIALPYESARARVELGRARWAAGERSAARLEWKAARSGFVRLGAAPDLRVVDDLLGDEAVPDPRDRQRVKTTFMFTDIVTSTNLLDLIGDADWEKLLQWHDRILRATIGEHAGEIVRHTGDGFFVTFGDPRDAVECAVDIQRRLRAHRREHGFAPWVRIGIHTAEATREGTDYAGRGVHVAARVGGLGDREEIVVSADTISLTGPIRFGLSPPRTVDLKGISEPVEVHTVEWR